MDWKPIVAGVDPSPEGAWAAAVAWRLGRMAGVPVALVHAVPEVGVMVGGAPVADVVGLRKELARAARELVLWASKGHAPPEWGEALEVRFGRPAAVIARLADEREAGLVVVGGKEHTTLGRWFAGSTAHDVVRYVPLPVLVATPTLGQVTRVLAAVDLSGAAAPTIATAEKYARLFQARLRVVYAVEPVPLAAELPTPVDPRLFEERATELLEEQIWPRITLPDAERVVRHGTVPSVIATEVREWGAELIVVGSHGKGWIDRVLLGSVTEALLRHLPASLLVVPVSARVGREPGERGERAEPAVSVR